jgi:tetratricopeptide (TPR) repeat protein
MKLKIFAFALCVSFCLLSTPLCARAQDNAEVLIYPTAEDGSIMNWLAVSPLPYNAAFIGDSLGYDPFAREGKSETTIRPRAGETVRGKVWRRMQWSGDKNGPSHMDLFAAAGKGMWHYGLTACFVYLYSPKAYPNARFACSSDDGLKVILNGQKIWSNQIQRAAMYDSDQIAAPLKQGWNTLLCIVDQAGGGHYLLGRFKDGEVGINDLEIALDPPSPNAKRFPAAKYNADASAALRAADALRAEGKFADAVAGYQKVADEFPLADVAPRALQGRAAAFFSSDGAPSLKQPQQAAQALNDLLTRYPTDLLAEYSLLELGRVQSASSDLAAAEKTYRSFQDRYPLSTLGAKSQLELGKLLSLQKKYEDAILTLRGLQKQFPDSDEFLSALIAIGDAYRDQNQTDKARVEYTAARALAEDWYQNKYGVDVGKQAWLRGLQEYLRGQLG